MTGVVVNDASSLIDLRKGQLLHVLLRLPYRFIVPLPIREEELLDFTPQEWRSLEDGGLKTHDLPSEEVAQVLALKREYSRLSSNDCFALVTATCQEDAILLTGDGLLRKVAAARDVRVHGVLWIIDELHATEACETELLVSALELWRDDSAVFLPSAEIDARLQIFFAEEMSFVFGQSVRRRLMHWANRTCRRLPDGSETLIAALARIFRDGSLKPMDDLLQERAAPCAEIAATKEPPSEAQVELERVPLIHASGRVHSGVQRQRPFPDVARSERDSEMRRQTGLQTNMTAQGPCNRHAPRRCRIAPRRRAAPRARVRSHMPYRSGGERHLFFLHGETNPLVDDALAGVAGCGRTLNCTR